jgi:hypothetical protein
VVPSQDLVTVIGRHPVTGSHQVTSQVVDRRTSTRWAIGVLAVAAGIGVIAAATITLAPGEDHAVAPSSSPAPEAAPSRLAQELGKVAPSVTPIEAVPPPARVDHPAPTNTAPDPTASTGTGATPGPRPPVRDTSVRATPARKKDPGILRVQSEPWAWASVAGQRRDTPTKFTLAPGRYTVRFQAENGKAISKAVTIESGKVATLTVNLEDDN